MIDDTKLLNGTKVAREIRGEVAKEVEALSHIGIQPRLDVVLVGDDPASRDGGG